MVTQEEKLTKRRRAAALQRVVDFQTGSSDGGRLGSAPPTTETLDKNRTLDLGL